MWEGFVENISFEPGVKEQWNNGDDDKDGLTQVDEDVNRGGDKIIRLVVRD